MWIIVINWEEPITSKGDLDELNQHKNSHEKSKVKISLLRSKIYQRTDLEEISPRFDQVRPVVSHIKSRLPKKPPTPKNICEGLKGLHRKFWKEALFVKYEKN